MRISCLMSQAKMISSKVKKHLWKLHQMMWQAVWTDLMSKHVVRSYVRFVKHMRAAILTLSLAGTANLNKKFASLLAHHDKGLYERIL